MKPAWLDKKISIKACLEMKRFLRGLCVETVCEQAMCPNIGECFLRREATFLILGRVCTRMCSFCNIEKGIPLPLDTDEPKRVAEAVKRLMLKHAVITSVTRDDLSDGGAGIFSETVLCIRRHSSSATIELLIPDFKLSLDALKAVTAVSPDIIAHNVETVPSFYPVVRQGADYKRSLEVLRIIKKICPQVKTKSGIMLGIGETKEEVLSVMKDLSSVGCDFLSIGQYLAPGLRHYPVKEYIRPEQFVDYKREGEKNGFKHIESGPYVRSSYMAADYLSILKKESCCV